MQKYFLSFILVCPVTVSAAEALYCSSSISVVIKNNTPQMCRLTQQILKQGEMKSNEVPITILPGTESKPYQLQNFGKTGPDIVLSYQCGEDKFVSIESARFTTTTMVSKPPDFWGRIYGKSVDEEHVIGAIVALSNINAHYETSQDDCSQNKPSTIVWTFEV